MYCRFRVYFQNLTVLVIKRMYLVEKNAIEVIIIHACEYCFSPYN